MDRRHLLRIGGTMLTAGVAGCSGILGGEDANETPAETEETERTTTTSTATHTTTSKRPQFDVAIDSSGPTRVGSDVTVRVTATNTGGRTGSLSETLRVSGPTTRTFPITIEDVTAGSRQSTAVTFSLEYAGTYALSLGNGAATTDLRVAPVDEFGSTVAVSDDLDLSVESVGVEPAVFVEGPGWGHLRNPVPGIVGSEMENPENWFVAVVEATVENTGTTETTFDPRLVGVRAGNGTDLPVHEDDTLSTGVDFGTARSAGGDPNLANTVVPPGGRVQGILLAPINRYLAGKTVSAVVQRDGESMPEAAWRNVASGERRRLPTFEVRDLSVPDEVEIGAERKFSVTVGNVGDAAGPFRGMLQDHIVDDKYTPLGTVEGRIPPGATKELTGTLVCPWSREREVVFRPSGLKDTIQARKARRSYGKTFTMPNGVTVKVFSPVYSDSVKYGQEYWSWGMWTVAVEAELPQDAKGEKLGKKLLPTLENFRCYRNNDDFPYAGPLRISNGEARKNANQNNNTLNSPVQGDLYPINIPQEPSGGTVGGWVTFTIGPDDYHFTLEKLEVQLIKNVFKESEIFKCSWSRDHQSRVDR